MLSPGLARGKLSTNAVDYSFVLKTVVSSVQVGFKWLSCVTSQRCPLLQLTWALRLLDIGLQSHFQSSCFVASFDSAQFWILSGNEEQLSYHESEEHGMSQFPVLWDKPAPYQLSPASPASERTTGLTQEEVLWLVCLISEAQKRHTSCFPPCSTWPYCIQTSI